MDGPRSEVGRTFSDMIHAYHQCISTKLNQLGLFRGQPPFMEELSRNGEMSQKQLAEVTKLSPATVTATVQRMQKAGLVTRRIDEMDQRVQLVTLTEDGKKLDRSARNVFHTVVNDVAFSGFSEEEKTQLFGYLQRITENLQRENGQARTR